MSFSWSRSKSAELKRTRGISFEDIMRLEPLAARGNPGRANQRILLFVIHDYIWVVPYVENDGEVFLKTLFPSRKYTKMWRAGVLL